MAALYLIALQGYGQGTRPLEKRVSVRLAAMPVTEAIGVLGDSAQVGFSYASDILPSGLQVTISAEEQSVKTILNKILAGTDVTYLALHGQVVLKKRARTNIRYVLEGNIMDKEDQAPISYATVQIKNTNLGVVADYKGSFSLELSDEHLGDTLTFYSMGYQKTHITVNNLLQKGTHRVFLTPEAIVLPNLEVTENKFQTIRAGNYQRGTGKSLYMDTHGQQTALYIANKENYEGIIGSVQYYLSKEGNTDAPFRVRVYAINSETNGPGEDLLNEFLVVKPDTDHGWYAVDLSTYDIPLPEEGFFVAMEGVFPNDYSFYDGDSEFETGKKKKKQGFQTSKLHYGQRLGYKKKKKNNTWHYALSQKWFQLDKRSFNVLIAAEVLVSGQLQTTILKSKQ